MHKLNSHEHVTVQCTILAVCNDVNLSLISYLFCFDLSSFRARILGTVLDENNDSE